VRQSQRHYAIEQYFLIEEMSEVKHEYFDGEIFAMAGGSRDHDTIAGNVFAFLHGALRASPCQAFSSNMRIRTPSGLYTYPDASIVCGPPDITRIQGTDTIGNPVVLIEVLSLSTSDYDRGQKFDLYESIGSLQDYLLIEQSSVLVEHRTRDSAGGWTTTTLRSLDDRIRLSAVEVEIPMAALYERVELLDRK
jgi:Uma2 family endonuclease